MIYDTLKDLLKQAEEHTIKGSFNEAETLATTVLAELEHASDSGEDHSVNERKKLHCSALINLASTSRLRGDFQEALAFARASLDIAEEYQLTERKVKAWNAVGVVYYYLGSYDKALEYYEQAFTFYNELGNKSEVADISGNIGILYAHLGSYDKALECYEQALAFYNELGNRSRVAHVTGNMGSVYRSLGSYDKALDFFERALAVHKELGEELGVATVMVNVGFTYHHLGSYDKALEYYEQALAMNKKIGIKFGVATVTGSIGLVYQDLGSYDKALDFFGQALAAHNELGNKAGVADVMGSIGELHTDKNYQGYDAAIAEEFLNNAIAVANEIGAKAVTPNFHKSLADLYEHEERWKDAFVHHKKYIEIQDELNIEETKKQDSIREQRKVIELAKAKADAKHQATEQLLHNVLPPSIANKMLDGTKLIAEKLPSVSVLFADIVGFTKLSQRITPEQLVEGLDKIFSAFDTLAEKYGLEKIKTIGDAYMVVAGAPEKREDHANAMAEFALEMVEAMKEFSSQSTGEQIQLRIGIHSGEVVAGVIGKKKFAYDLWGDAVNTASRMESHGEAGRIHCSSEFTEELLRTVLPAKAGIHFAERGELEIKGKGKMRTYFLEIA